MGQKKEWAAKMSLDSGRIGTEKRAGSAIVSRKWANRDRKESGQCNCVSIVAESGQKKERAAKMSLDSGRIGTEKRASNATESR
ncbi:hypothetical protein [Metabacillus litoralis]|uniref:hypothetical protein n=1 Tax=Metabacillus litoralis TaxID=152268 RepID=UPI0013CE7844|nr:hypothetical protein [Metabacillus litoralis]